MRVGAVGLGESPNAVDGDRVGLVEGCENGHELIHVGVVASFHQIHEPIYLHQNPSTLVVEPAKVPC